MLKRIEKSKARVGMFVEIVEGSWLTVPLQQRRFLLTNEAAQQLKASEAEAIVINTSKGVDVITALPTESCVQAQALERRAADAAVILRAVHQSAAVLKRMFDGASSGEAISFDETAQAAEQISETVERNPALFISVTRLKSKDETTYIHSVAVSGLMSQFGRYLGLDERTVELLGIAGLLHDVGKIDIPESILNKHSLLDEEEMQIIRAHPTLGHQILSRQTEMPPIVLDICLHHHERIDGRGYPHKLSGGAVGFFPRLAAICDVYDAITSVRPYKTPWSAIEALRWMMRSDGQFDKQLLRKFALCLALSHG